MLVHTIVSLHLIIYFQDLVQSLRKVLRRCLLAEIWLVDLVSGPH